MEVKLDQEAFVTAIYTNIRIQDPLEAPDQLQYSQKINFFIYSKIEEIGLLFSFLGVYLGASARQKKHGMIRIKYSDYEDYHNNFILYFGIMIKLWIARLVILVICFFLPCFIIPYVLIQYYIPQQFHYDSIQCCGFGLISLLSITLINYLIFNYFELICAWFERDFNHFEISSQDDPMQKMSNFQNQDKFYENLNDLDTSSEYKFIDLTNLNDYIMNPDLDFENTSQWYKFGRRSQKDNSSPTFKFSAKWLFQKE